MSKDRRNSSNSDSERVSPNGKWIMEKKNALKVLTTNDIRNHARDWTLAGDVGLLAHLEQFSESVINKTQETQANFNELVDDYEELFTKVGNITNQFLALQNCQFVENRVYDEETPTEEKPEVKVQNEEDQEKLLLMQYKEAVEVGIKLLDTHFQEVQLPPNSDSDDEDEVSSGNSIIWKPKNPYASKKFPFLIGSSEWWADDNVGLRPNKESLDTEKIISESESDMESLKSVDKMKSSSSSSMENIKSIPIKPTFMESTEDLFGFDKNEILKNNASDAISKGSGSLAEESSNFLPEFDTKEPETEAKKRDDSSDEHHPEKQPEQKPNQDEILPSKPKKVDNEFTRELMAKLVSVTSNPENGTEKKKEPQQKQQEKKKERVEVPPVVSKPKAEDGLFDETDDSSDLFSTNISKVTEKVDSGKKSLFFDAENDDELFKGENDLFCGSSLFEGDVFKKPESFPVGKSEQGSRTEAKVPKKKEPAPPKKNLVNDLFDDLDDDDDTLFAAKPVNKKPPEKSSTPMEKDSLKESKPAAASTLVWDTDEGLFDSVNKKVDGDLFDSSDLFDTKVSKTEPKKKEESLPPEEPQPVTKPENNIPSTKQDPPLLSSTEKDTTDDPFGFSSTKDTTLKKISILDSDEEDDLFSKSFTTDKKPAAKTLPNDSNDVEEDDDDTSLFAEKPKPSDSVSVSSSRSSLFDDVSASKSRLASVFEKDKTTKNDDSLVKPGRDLFSAKGKEEKNSLFDDCDDDDLFSVTTKTESKKAPEEPPKVEEKKKTFVDDGEDDLFKLAPSAKLRGTKSDILRQSDEKLFTDDDSDLFTEKSKPKPPSSLCLKPKETYGKGQTVGKLNIPDNLKVKFESVAKKISPGGAKPPSETEEKKEDTLDEPLQPSGLLKCPSKDRVKIPGKRRPQSRRARQEAIRNSGNWDQPLSPSTSQPKESPVVSNPLSPSTDEEDFFKVPELDKNFEQEDQSIFKSDLFESSSSKLDDNLLFDGAPVLSPLAPKKAEETVEKPESTPETETLFGKVKTNVRSIFDDDDDLMDEGESLFKSSKPVQESVFQPTGKENSKKPLFDPDMDDDDDLFGGKIHPTPSKLPPAEKPKDGGEQKGSSSFVDPLGLMSNQ